MCLTFKVFLIVHESCDKQSYHNEVHEQVEEDGYGRENKHVEYLVVVGEVVIPLTQSV